MATFLDQLAPGRARYLDVRHNPGFTNHVVETAEYLGASYMAARVNTQYGERAKIRGVEMTYAAGILGKLLAVGADVMGNGGEWSTHLNTISTAFIATHLAALGAQHGLQAAGGGRALPRQTALGAIPEAPQPGKFLNLDEVNRIAAMHG